MGSTMRSVQISKWLGCPLVCLGLLVVGVRAEEAQPASENVSQTEPESTISSSNFRSRVRYAALAWLGRDEAQARAKYGVFLDEQVANADATKPLVIFVHGFNSAPQRNESLAAPVRKAGFPCGSFRYPNDQSIEESAALLSRELKKIAKEHKNRKVALVTMSMGGLVAREAIENKALDPKNVERLIMIAPPSHGSSLASIPCSADIWEHLVKRNGRSMYECLCDCVEDGLDEARDDLTPGSPFLKRLNARRRNPQVAYTIFLGTGGRLTQEQLDALDRSIDEAAGNNRLVAFAKPTLKSAIASLNDSVKQGDGVVSVERGRLEGVDDTVLLDFNHWNVNEEPRDKAVAQVHEEILNRLKGEAGAKK